MEVDLVRQMILKDGVVASSTLAARRSSPVVPRRPGILTSIRVKEGNRVDKGYLLAELENTREKLAIERTQLSLDKAKEELKRFEELLAQNAGTKNAVEEARFQVRSLELSLKEAKQALSDTKITAPFGGTVVERHAEVGTMANGATPLFVMAETRKLEIHVSIPEADLWRVKKGQEATIYPLALSGEAFRAQVLRIRPAVDVQSGTVRVTLALKNHAVLRPGMFSKVLIHTDLRENATAIPKKALVYENQTPYVFQVDLKKEKTIAQKVNVQLGIEDRDFVEILDGLHPGETIVIQGQNGLKDRAEVTVLNPPPAPQNNKPSENVKAEAKSRKVDKKAGARIQ